MQNTSKKPLTLVKHYHHGWDTIKVCVHEAEKKGENVVESKNTEQVQAAESMMGDTGKEILRILQT